jgi:beta-galactosidase
MKSVLGYFETLSELGINCNIKEFGEFDFSKSDYTGNTIILAHQISVPSKYAAILESFVSKGGKLMVDGLTGFFDDDLHNTMKTGFPFAKLLGGNISEFKVVDNMFEVNVGQVNLPAHLWRGFISNNTGEILSTVDGLPVATRNRFGKGETLWIPSLVGLGARLSDNSHLATFLTNELKTNISNAPFIFVSQQKGCLMKTLQSGNSFVTVVVNKSLEKKIIGLKLKDKTKKPTVLFADKKGTIAGENITVAPEETVVVEWR